MNPGAGVPDAVRKAFPGREALVERGVRESAAFRSLCADYLACLRALDHWKGRRSEEAGARRAEYEQLLAELGREIRSWLEAFPAGPG